MSGEEEVKPEDNKKKVKYEKLAKARAVGKEKRLAKEKRLSELEEKLSRLDNIPEKPEEKPVEKPVLMSDDCDDSENTPQVVTRASKKLKTLALANCSNFCFFLVILRLDFFKRKKKILFVFVKHVDQLLLRYTQLIDHT